MIKQDESIDRKMNQLLKINVHFFRLFIPDLHDGNRDIVANDSCNVSCDSTAG
jgi:hypothetical protein